MPLGAELRVVLARGLVDRWGGGLHVNGGVHAFVGPQEAFRDHARVDLAEGLAS